MFVCNKYDKFSSSPNEIKKVVNTYLRVIAKIINAPLIQVSYTGFPSQSEENYDVLFGLQVSNQSESSMLKFKKILNKLVFKAATSITNETDINKVCKSTILWSPL